MNQLAIWENENEAVGLFDEAVKNTTIEAVPNVIASQSDWQCLKSYDSIHVIYIQESLKWYQDKDGDNNGFGLLLHLREAGFRGTIFLVSNFSYESLNKRHGSSFEIMLSPAHILIDPIEFISGSDVKSAFHQLSTEGLSDINYYFLNPAGKVEETFHHIKNLIYSSDLKYLQQAIPELFDEICKKLPDFSEEIAAMSKQCIAHLSDDHSKNLNTVERYKHEVLELLELDHDELNLRIQKKPDWLILCIDDEEHIASLIMKNFAERNLNCITVNRAESAFELLDLDIQGKLPIADSISNACYPPNSITVLITDIRMLEKGSKKWQRLQGYDIVNHVAQNMSNMLSYVYLTSKTGAILQHLEQKKTIQVTAISKSRVLDTPKDFQYFAERIRASGNEVYESIIGRPKSGYWNQTWKNKILFPYRIYYRFHRLSDQYKTKEKYIEDSAERFIGKAEFAKDESIRSVTKVDNEDLKLMTQMMVPPEPDSKVMNKFYDKLIGRRIAIGLHLKAWTSTEIAIILKDRTFEKAKSFKQSNQLLSSYLCLSKEMDNEIAYNLLVEEKAWVKSYFGFAIEDANKFIFEELSQSIDRLESNYKRKDVESKFNYLFDSEVRLITVLDIIKTFEGHFELSKTNIHFQNLFQKELNKILSIKVMSDALNRLNVLDFLKKMKSSELNTPIEN